MSLDQACGICPPGFYCPPGTADYMDNPCPRGAYCTARPDKTTAIVTPLFKLCPEGKFNDRPYGRSEADCQLCAAGYYCQEGQNNKGNICPEDYFCGVGSIAKCPAGTYGGYRTGKISPDQCLLCPPGHWCGLGTKTPNVLSAGLYSPLSGLVSED